MVDDHELVRTGIHKILNEVKGLKVVGELNSGEAAIQFCRKHEPDVVLMDINMPGIGGLEATKKIVRYTPEVKVIVLTVHNEDPFPTKVMQIGAAGYLTKGAGSDEMVKAIRAVHSGQRYLTSAIAQQMALSQFKSPEENPFSTLSERELQIMLMITRGEKVPDISLQLNLSTKTINSYRYRMFEKLNVGNDVALTHLAIRYGMLRTESF